MRIALFRARDDAEGTAKQLRGLGHETVVAPVLEVVATGAALPAGPFSAAIFASAHAVETLRPDNVLSLQNLSAFCVGSRTAARAHAAGLLPIGVAADAARLVRLICSDLPQPAKLLLVAGRQRKPVIEDGLRAANHDVSITESYEAQAIATWPKNVIALMQEGRIDAALHYSRRSAHLAMQCAARSGLDEPFRSATHYCLSKDVAAALSDAGVGRIVVAQRANEASLLACLVTDHP